MHCGRVPCGPASCSASSAFVKEVASSTVHDGRTGRFVSPQYGTAVAMAMSRARDFSASQRAVRRVVCDGSSTGSRRVSYKRRQQPPLKGFPTTHEADVFDAHKHQQDLQKTRALEFVCENDETIMSDGAFHLPHNFIDDGSWSSRILTQVHGPSQSSSSNFLRYFFPNLHVRVLFSFQAFVQWLWRCSPPFDDSFFLIADTSGPHVVIAALFLLPIRPPASFFLASDSKTRTTVQEVAKCV